MDGAPGLRELKKQLTRESIADAALRLVLEKGLEHVTIEEIAQLAFVSPRTFSNYFACKEEAVAAAGSPNLSLLQTELSARPANEASLRAAAVVLVEAERRRTPEQLRLAAQQLELSERYPTLRPFRAAQYDQLEVALRNGVAARGGYDVAADLHPWLVAGVAVAVLRSTYQLWVQTGAEPGKLPELLESAFTAAQLGLEGGEGGSDPEVAPALEQLVLLPDDQDARLRAVDYDEFSDATVASGPLAS